MTSEQFAREMARIRAEREAREREARENNPDLRMFRLAVATNPSLWRTYGLKPSDNPG